MYVWKILKNTPAYQCQIEYEHMLQQERMRAKTLKTLSGASAVGTWNGEFVFKFDEGFNTKDWVELDDGCYRPKKNKKSGILGAWEVSNKHVVSDEYWTQKVFNDWRVGGGIASNGRGFRVYRALYLRLDNRGFVYIDDIGESKPQLKGLKEIPAGEFDRLIEAHNKKKVED